MSKKPYQEGKGPRIILMPGASMKSVLDFMREQRTHASGPEMGIAAGFEKLDLGPNAALDDIMTRAASLPEIDDDFWANLLDVPKTALIPNFENETLDLLNVTYDALSECFDMVPEGELRDKLEEALGQLDEVGVSMSAAFRENDGREADTVDRVLYDMVVLFNHMTGPLTQIAPAQKEAIAKLTADPNHLKMMAMLAEQFLDAYDAGCDCPDCRAET